MRAPRALVTGGAGFVGSHLCDRLLAEGWEVVCVDSLLTGDLDNIADAARDPRFGFVEADVSEGLGFEHRLDWVLHLACPASPTDYLAHPIETLRVGAVGTLNALELAHQHGAGFLIASTSEVYGDPLVHPQPETYWGNVNPIGPRAVYDEAKRFGEAATAAFRRRFGLRSAIVRIFNTYGPRMRIGDGRAVPTFIAQAFRGEPITVHGDGSQTRSLCYVDDLIDGIRRVLAVGPPGPLNLGSPEEVTVLHLAELVRSKAGSTSEIVLVDRPEDDPQVRCPDVTLAVETLNWRPRTTLHDGLDRTVAWFEPRIRATAVVPSPGRG